MKATKKHMLERGRHPFGVQPWGNYYSSDVPPCRDVGLGRLGGLKDEVVLDILGHLDAIDLCHLALVSKSFYVFAHQDDLWKSLVCNDFGGDFIYTTSWKATYQCRKRPDLVIDYRPLPIAGFFSDLIFQSFYCASIAINPRWISTDNIDRRSNLSLEQFIAEYEKPNRPVLITDVVKQWPAYQLWDRDNLLSRFGDVVFTAGGISFPLSNYYAMADNVREENPLYLFDPRFGEKAPAMAAEYSVPEYFREDLFSLLGEQRPNYRWLIIGPARSGSNFHIDPNCTSAWNAVIRGAKKWILFPPQVSPPGVYASEDGADVASPFSLMEWFVNFYNAAVSGPVKPVECICRAGEMIFVPRGWWHAVLNLEDSVAITQNYVSGRNLSEVCRFLREKSDQASGFPDKSVSAQFEMLYRQAHPGVLEQLEADEAAARVPSIKPLFVQDTSFSFSF
eukprot:TRINITY_DN12376_c0_g1_i1.p1 TRINITY_DN12376_c0_g1~~TRINITY_DN12376_c0_g1_i1.p1  ORF type:complete len:467 (-),score=66.88 TRINITY_DN12376_c0_g1_i1:41-1390(-)